MGSIRRDKIEQVRQMSDDDEQKLRAGGELFDYACWITKAGIRSQHPEADEATVPPPAPGKQSGPTGRRRTRMPLIEVARAATEAEAREGLERWKERHPGPANLLAPNDVLVDSMRGRSTTWTRIRLNLRHVPEADRPPQEALEVDYDPWEGVRFSEEERAQWRRHQSAQDQSGSDSPT